MNIQALLLLLCYQLSVVSGLFDVFRYAGHVGGLVLEIRVHVAFVENGAVEGLDARLKVGQSDLVERLDRVHGLFQTHFGSHCLVCTLFLYMIRLVCVLIGGIICLCELLNSLFPFLLQSYLKIT